MPQEMVESTAKPKTFREASTFARAKRPAMAQERNAVIAPTYSVPQDMFNYIFILQGNVEKQRMDYHKYARIMWEELAGQDPDSPGFETFQENMVARLHNTEMKDLIFPHLSKSMSDLVETYKDDVESVNLWSTGDVTSTGYQPGKIDKSKVVPQFLSAVRNNLTRQETTEFVRKKTNYMVDDDKFSRLVDYAGNVLETRSGQPLKLVIIEDSSGNFEKARKALDAKFGEGKVEVIPVWFTGSREGLTAADRLADFLEEGGDEAWLEKDAFEEKKTRLNAIGTFDELIDRDRFGPLFKGAHVMLDFDGVVCDNVGMRRRQASAIYNSLLDGVVNATGDRRELAAQRVLANLPR